MFSTRAYGCACRLEGHLSAFYSRLTAISKPVVGILWLLAFSMSEKSQKMNFQYTLDLQEELPRSTVVTNLQGLFHQLLSEFPKENQALIHEGKTKFRFLEPNTLFYIDSNNPSEQLLRVQSRVDREAGCTTDSLCCQQANPSGQMDPFSSLARRDECNLVILFLVDIVASNTEQTGLEQFLFQLNLRILDINDNTPTWNTATSASVGAQHFNTSTYLHGSRVKMPVTIPKLHVSIPEHTSIGTRIVLPLAVDFDAAPENTTTSYKIETQTETNSFLLDWNGPPDGKINEHQSTSSVDGLKQASSLWLRVNKDLDHDRQPGMFVIIAASDSSGISSQTGYLLLNISVTDVNDHPPKFKKKRDQVWVREHSAIGSVLYRALASDADSSDQGRLTFDFSPSMITASWKLFSINKRTGEIAVNGVLDFELAYEHTLVISLSDGKWTDEMVLSVNVLNVNDHSPEITLYSHLAVFSGDTHALQASQFKLNQAHLSIVVPENGSPDQLIATVTVRDKDFSADLRAKIRVDAAEMKDNNNYHTGHPTEIYTAYPSKRSLEARPFCKLNSGQFRIDPLQIGDLIPSEKFRFKISLAGKPLDREQQSHIHLQILCQDEEVSPAYGDYDSIHRPQTLQYETMGYTERRTATALLRIIVSDENDCQPVYNGPYSAKLLESAPADTFVLQLQATDADEPSTSAGNNGLRYSLNGAVKLIPAENLANELTNKSDDNKAVNRGRLPRKYVSLPHQPWFYLNALTGELKSLVPFDRESVRAVMVPVEIRDGGDLTEGDNLKTQNKHYINRINVTLTVDIMDVNDCTPTFSNQIYELNVSENAHLPMHLGKLHVIDCDIEENNRRVEFLVKDSPYQTGAQSLGQLINRQAENRLSFARWFSISKSGDLFYRTPVALKTMGVNGIDLPLGEIDYPLDREKTELIVLDVFARDSGSPALTGSAQLLIHVLDVNDHAPKWQFPRTKHRSVNVSVDTPIGHEVTRVSQDDSDTFRHCVQYSAQEVKHQT